MSKERLKELMSFKEGCFKLSSGRETNFYIDFRPAMCRGEGLDGLVSCLTQVLGPIITNNHVLCGVPTSGLILASALLPKLGVYRPNIGMAYVRQKDHGTKRTVEYSKKGPVILIDDVITTGKTLVKIALALEKEDFFVERAIVLFDRSISKLDLGFSVNSILNNGDL